MQIKFCQELVFFGEFCKCGEREQISLHKGSIINPQWFYFQSRARRAIYRCLSQSESQERSLFKADRWAARVNKRDKRCE